MSETASFTVRGTPRPKGSFTRMPNGAMLPASTTAGRLRKTQWRNDLREAALAAMGERAPFNGPIRLMVEFSFLPPRTTIRKYQFGWLCHTKKPDIDKLIRALCDALQGIVYRNDSQVCFLTVNKVYAWDGVEGAEVDATEIDDESAQRYATQSEVVRNAVHAMELP